MVCVVLIIFLYLGKFTCIQTLYGLCGIIYKLGYCVYISVTWTRPRCILQRKQITYCRVPYVDQVPVYPAKKTKIIEFLTWVSSEFWPKYLCLSFYLCGKALDILIANFKSFLAIWRQKLNILSAVDFCFIYVIVCLCQFTGKCN